VLLTEEGLMRDCALPGALHQQSQKIPSRLYRTAVAVTLGGGILIATVPGHAEDEGFFSRWLKMVSRTQAEQPHWITPLATNNSILTQSFHYDVLSQRLPNESYLNNYGGGKGLEFIPFPRIEVILAVPPWEQHSGSPSTTGMGDWSALMKYRFWSANEEQGNYAVSGFVQYFAATGGPGFTTGTDILHTGLLMGKGWAPFNIQLGLAAEFPLSGNLAAHNFGKPLLANMVAQYQIWSYVWPEVELNFTYWPDGLRQGNAQLFVTPGIVFGPFPLKDRFKLAVGGGYQFAVTQNPAYTGSLIFSARLYF
jgi:hypothetical protein